VVTRRCPADAAGRAARLALVVTDNDGVLTDGTVYVSPTGEHMKAYSVRDGMGVERLRERGIATGVLTREQPDLIAPRAAKLALRHLWTGVRDKLAHLGRILEEAAVGLDQVAYIGDDVNDLGILEAVGEGRLDRRTGRRDATGPRRGSLHMRCTRRARRISRSRGMAAAPAHSRRPIMRSDVRIGNKLVGDGRPVYVIAEIGINHNGSVDIAKRMIDGAVLAGCDAVKFQKRTPSCACRAISG